MRLFFRSLRSTWLIIAGLMLFLAGLAIVRFRFDQTLVISITVILTLLAMLLMRQRRFGVLVAVGLLVCFGVGYVRGTAFLDKLHIYEELYGQNVTLQATAREDAVYSERRQLSFAASDISLKQPFEQRIIGAVSVEGHGAPMVYKGDRVEIKGNMYPRRGENQAGVSFATISVLSEGSTGVDTLRRQFAAGTQNILPEPLASFSLGLLIGQRSTLPQQLEDELTEVGLIHIVAVSGYNLTIIVNMSRRVLAKRSRYQSVVISGVLIGIFLLITGYSPSIVRAAVVSGIGLTMWYYGRNIKPLMVLLLSAVLTASVNPLFLWSSIGWYLSFTAFFGVLVVAPQILKFLKPSWQNKLLPQILSETFAAQICTLPIILFIFGRLSIISIVANLLVIPFIPFAMLAGLVAGTYGMVGPFLLGGLLVLPAKVILDYILSVSSLLAGVPYANVEFKILTVHMVWMYAFILLVSIMLWRKNHKQPRVLTE